MDNHQTSMTIVVPCHGRTTLLRRTLESISSQSTRDFNVIISDDSGTEKESKEVLAICHKILGSQSVKFEYIFTKRNLGQVNNTNQGLKAARGEYVRILHSDDILHPETIEYELDAFKRIGRDLLCVFHEHIPFSGESMDFEFHAERGEICSYDDIVLGRLHSDAPFPSGVAVKRTILEQAGYMDDSYKRACDWELFYRIVKCIDGQSGKLLSVSRKYIGYRVHEDSNTENPATRFLNFYEYERIARGIERDLIDRNYGEKTVNLFVNRAAIYRYVRLLKEIKSITDIDRDKYRERIWEIISRNDDVCLFQKFEPNSHLNN